MYIKQDIACPACACVCDDLRVAVEGEQIAGVDGGCPRGRSWFLRQNDAQRPLAEIDGREASLDAAVDRAAELLAAANYPLITGLGHSSTPGLRAAIALAESLGATIDPAARASQTASLWALQNVGMSTATLGEIRERADLVLFWGVDPATTHPRLVERFIDPPGQFFAVGKTKRTVIAIDAAPTATSARADEFMQLDPADTITFIARLRESLRGGASEHPARADSLQPSLQALAERLKSCRTGAVFFSFAALPMNEAARAAASLLLLVRDIHEHARFYARPLPERHYGNAENVLAWQTGFPLAVDFGRGWPHYSPGEASAEAVLARREADVCLFIGSDEAAQLSLAARAHLATIPTIAIDDAATPTTPLSTAVRFTTAVYGIHLAGTAYRLDDVPLPLRAILPAKFPSDAEVLRRIEERVAARSAGG